MPEREYFSQSNIKPLWTHRAIALSQSIYGLSMFFQCCCDVQNLHVSPQEESRKYFIFGSVPLVRRVRVTALESSHWSQNVIWDFMINDFYFCGQSNNHDHYFNHHHIPSHHLTGGRHGQNCLLVRLRRVVPCRQISHPGHPMIRVKTGQVHYFPSKVKHFLPTSLLQVDQDSPLLDPSSGFWHSNGQIVTIVSELEL